MTSTVPAAPSATPTPIAPARGVGPSVRRVIVFGLLFTMVVIAAIGVTTLLTRLIDVANYRLAASDTAGLALALAFSLVAGPLALLLWWAAWRQGLAARI